MTYQAASGARRAADARADRANGPPACVRARSAGRPGVGDSGNRPCGVDDAAVGSASARSIGAPLAGSLIPWIHTDLGDGISGEERKAGAEANKILGRPAMGKPGSLIVEGLCVRIGAMRCHSQALTIKLRADLPLTEIEKILADANEWVTVDSEQSRRQHS